MWASPRVRTSMSAPDLRGNIEVKGRVKGGGQECPPHTFTVQKQKATLIPERGLHLMPATREPAAEVPSEARDLLFRFVVRLTQTEV